MDELSLKLAEILNDPQSMEKVRQMADSLFSGDKEESAPPTEQGFMPDANSLKSIMGIMSSLNSKDPDNRTALLMALKPHLSEKRRGRVDSAVKLMKLIEILPALKESGIIDI